LVTSRREGALDRRATKERYRSNTVSSDDAKMTSFPRSSFCPIARASLLM
jgi:hypothetical protein